MAGMVDELKGKVAELAQRFVAQEKLGDMVEDLTSRFAAILDGLYKKDLVQALWRGRQPPALGDQSIDTRGGDQSAPVSLDFQAYRV